MKIRPLFKWYDLWIGVYIDRPGRRVYILPLPMIGIVIDYWPRFLAMPFTKGNCWQCGLPESYHKGGKADMRCPLFLLEKE